MAEDDRVILDSSSFKALASETRVLILKELDKKRSTASEIAKALGISAQSASEHLENMRVAGLVERVESSRKWVYFQLTEKGKAVLHPENKKFWIFLSIAFLAITSLTLFYMQGVSFSPAAMHAQPPGNLVGSEFPANELSQAENTKALAAPLAITDQINATNETALNESVK